MKLMQYNAMRHSLIANHMRIPMQILQIEEEEEGRLRK